MKNKSYIKAIEFIAENDEPKILNWIEMVDLISVVLVAHVFEVNPKEVAKAVIEFRLYGSTKIPSVFNKSE